MFDAPVRLNFAPGMDQQHRSHSGLIFHSEQFLLYMILFRVRSILMDIRHLARSPADLLGILRGDGRC